MLKETVRVIVRLNKKQADVYLHLPVSLPEIIYSASPGLHLRLQVYAAASGSS